MLVLGIDIGTTSVGVCLLKDKAILCQKAAAHNAYISQLPDCTAEQNVEVILGCLISLILDVLAQTDDFIDGIAIGRYPKRPSLLYNFVGTLLKGVKCMAL